MTPACASGPFSPNPNPRSYSVVLALTIHPQTLSCRKKRERKSYMRLFGWFRRAPQEDQDVQQSPRRWAWIGGRRMLTSTPYVFPKDKLEGDRLDLQHHLYK